MMKTRRHVHDERKSTPTVIKEVVFIRHGHSLGQAASHDARKHDDSLRDADLSPIGINQAFSLGKAVRRNESKPDLVLSSPLTRALRTALMSFQDEKVIVHPGFAELNDRRPIPENRGRPVQELLEDHTLVTMGVTKTDRVDLSLVETLKWPLSSPVDGIEYLRTRSEEKVVIFSHHNYILKNLGRYYADGGVQNCKPIHCFIHFSSEGHKVHLAEVPHAWCDLYGKKDMRASEEGENID